MRGKFTPNMRVPLSTLSYITTSPTPFHYPYPPSSPDHRVHKLQNVTRHFLSITKNELQGILLLIILLARSIIEFLSIFHKMVSFSMQWPIVCTLKETVLIKLCNYIEGLSVGIRIRTHTYSRKVVSHPLQQLSEVHLGIYMRFCYQFKNLSPNIVLAQMIPHMHA